MTNDSVKPQNSKRLLDYKKRIFSQGGEDGVIERILHIIPEKDKWCVEFGAWDGQHLSNTRYLIEKYEYSAVLIEGDEQKFFDLKKFYSKNKNIVTLNKFVGWGKMDGLDAILCDREIPHNFDFLSVDIDGNDFHVFAALSDYRPKLICIEFNPSIPTNIEFVQKANFSVNQGSSLLSLVQLAKSKGYELIEVLPCNAFFVRNEYFSLFDIVDNSPEKLREDNTSITNIFMGYDGTIFLSGYKMLPWHGIMISEKKIQMLPCYLRKFPSNYSVVQRFCFCFLRYILRIKNKIKNIWSNE